MSSREDEYRFERPVSKDLERPFARPDKVKDQLYVITPIFNAPRFRSRWRLYADFRKMVAEAGAILITIEVAFGDRDFVVTSPDNPRDIQLRTSHELWLKEQMINLAAQRLPHGAKYIAWVDADCHFARYDWVDETIHLLQRYPVIQMWSQLHDLNSEHELVGVTRSFGSVWVENGSILGQQGPDFVPKLSGPPHVVGQRHHHHGKHKQHDEYPYPDIEPLDVMDAAKPKKTIPGYPGAPGLAWAMRREAWDQLGGLIDYCILGAGDWYMAHALTGQASRIVRPDQGRLGEKILEWQARAASAIWQGRPVQGNLGVMRGVVLHYWHGPKTNRLYQSREKILVANQYNPDLDLLVDTQGLYQVTNRKPQLRRDLQWYWSQRNEDALTQF
jgi:hypothetical protein